MDRIKIWNVRNVKKETKEAYVNYAKEEGITVAKALEKRKPKKK